MPNTNRHVDCQEYLTAVLRIAKITWDPQDRPAYNKCFFKIGEHLAKLLTK